MKNDPFDELAAKVDRQRERIDTLAGKVSDKTGSLKKIGTRLDTLETTVGTTDKRLTQESAKIAELRRDYDALHRKVRLLDGLPRADFDNWHPDITPDVVQLIRANLASAPVSDAALQKLHEKLDQAKEELTHWDEALPSAIKAARALTDLPVAAERLWRRELETWLAFRRSGVRPVKKVEIARQQLDDALRAHKSATTSAERSAAADEAACATIRERVEDAIARDLVPPQWFDSALGLFPPKEPGQIEPWLVVATRLVRYRLIAEVRERLKPFGDRPAEATLAREYDKVVELCSRQRR